MFLVLAEVEPVNMDAVVLHVATNHLETISNDIRCLDETLDQHRRLIQETQKINPGVTLAVSGVPVMMSAFPCQYYIVKSRWFCEKFQEKIMLVWMYCAGGGV